MSINETMPSGDLLLQLFREHLKQQLREKIKDTVDREVNTAIDGAIASLKAQIDTEYDVYARKLHAVVITHEVKK